MDPNPIPQNLGPAPCPHPRILRDPAEARALTVFYHAGCPDGVTGAWAAWLALPAAARAALEPLGGVFTDGRRGAADAARQLATAGTVFQGLTHDGAAPAAALTRDRHVVYIDFAPDAATALRLAAEARSLTVLDHHRSAAPAFEALRGSPAAGDRVYREDASGAQLAWDWAHPGRPRPQVVDYVADRDLYAWELPESRAVNKALFTEGVTRGFGPLTDAHTAPPWGLTPFRPAAWTDSLRDWQGLAERGAAYLRYEEQLVARLAAAARPGVVAARLPGDPPGAAPREYSVRVVNTPVLASEVGEAAMARADAGVHFVIAWSHAPDAGEIWASARTTRPDVDLSAIAPGIVGARNGGGHPGAAGFAVPGDSIAAVVRWPPAGR